MAKPKCEICNDKRSKRKCSITEGQLICPTCCADLRNEACEGCRYYQAAARYEASKTGAKAKNFLMEINEEVDDAVDGALALVDQGNFTAARRILRDLEKQHPRSHMVMYGLGTASAFEGNFDKGIEYFKKAVEIYPYFVHAYYNMGTAYQKKFDLRRSVECMKKVIEIGSDEELVEKARDSVRLLEEGVMETSHITLDEFIKGQELFDAAFSQMEKGRWERAIEGFRESLKTNSQMAQVHGNMGICHMQLGEKSKALAAFDRALEIDPSYEPAIVNRMQAEKAREGEPPTIQKMESIEYYPEYPYKNKSYLQSLLKKRTE